MTNGKHGKGPKEDKEKEDQKKPEVKPAGSTGKAPPPGGG